MNKYAENKQAIKNTIPNSHIIAFSPTKAQKQYPTTTIIVVITVIAKNSSIASPNILSAFILFVFSSVK
jgi:hypothetical protein